MSGQDYRRKAPKAKGKPRPGEDKPQQPTTAPAPVILLQNPTHTQQKEAQAHAQHSVPSSSIPAAAFPGYQDGYSSRGYRGGYGGSGGRSQSRVDYDRSAQGPHAGQDPSASAAPSAAGPPKLKSIKLLSEQFQFGGETVVKILSEEAGAPCSVIGIIGRQLVGKSTVMNLLAGYSKVKHFQVPVLSADLKKTDNKRLPFKITSPNSLLMAQHQTQGLDIYITQTPDRLVLIDSQPIDSASLVTRLIKMEVPLLPDCKNYENMAHLLSIQVTLQLMSICNVLLVVDDGQGLPNVFKHLHTVQMTKWLLPQDISTDISPVSQTHATGLSIGGQYAMAIKSQLNSLRQPLEKILDQGDQGEKGGRFDRRAHRENRDPLDYTTLELPKESYPEIIFVLNKQNQADLAHPRHRSVMTQMVHDLFSPLEAFKKQQPEKESESSSSSRIEVLFLPNFDDNASQVALSWDAAVAKFRASLLSATGSSFQRPLIEKEWLKIATKMWDIVRHSPVVQEYNAVLKATVYKDAPNQHDFQ